MKADSISAPEGATTFTNNDAAITAAWDRRATAFLAVRALPDDPATGGETDEQSEQWAIIDAAEAEIRSGVATTARGAEIQLWCAAVYQFDDAEDEAPCYRGDLDYFIAQGDKRDWKDRLLLAALRSLRDQKDAEAAFIDKWLAAWIKDGGSVVIDDEGKAQIGWVMYDLSPNYRAPDPAWTEAVRDNTFLHAQATHDATMKTRFDALRMAPGAVDALKVYMQAKGIRVAVHTMEQGK